MMYLKNKVIPTLMALSLALPSSAFAAGTTTTTPAKTILIDAYSKTATAKTGTVIKKVVTTPFKKSTVPSTEKPVTTTTKK